MIRLVHLPLALVAALLLSALPARAGDPARPTVVVVVRHGEKAAEPAANPVLSPEGHERARRLERLLARAGVTAIYSSEFARTRLTVAPLAETLKLEPRVVPASDVAGLVARILAETRGGVAVVAGHSNTVPAIVEALGGGAVGPIGDREYSDLFIVTVYAPGQASVVRLTY